MHYLIFVTDMKPPVSRLNVSQSNTGGSDRRGKTACEIAALNFFFRRAATQICLCLYLFLWKQTRLRQFKQGGDVSARVWGGGGFVTLLFENRPKAQLFYSQSRYGYKVEFLLFDLNVYVSCLIRECGSANGSILLILHVNQGPQSSSAHSGT